MSAPSKKRPDPNHKLDPEDPDFFKDCLEMAALMVGNDIRDPALREHLIRQFAATSAYLAHTEEQAELLGCLPGLPCSFGGGDAGPKKRRRNPKPKPGGRSP